MDLALSPDFDARICYGIVFLCAILSACLQVRSKFTALKVPAVWVWRAPTTWLIFGIYIVTPLGLFWLMDRANALNDTSLFAALLVALAYPAILAGGFGGLKASGGLAGIFKPLTAFTDSLVEQVNKQLAQMEKGLADHMVGRMVRASELFDELLQKVRSNTLNATDIDTDFKDIEAKNISDKRLLLEKKARMIYFYLTSTPEDIKALTDNEAWIGDNKKSPLHDAWRNVGSAIFILLLVLGGGFWASLDAKLALRYNIWRLSKPNNSAEDRHRSCERLVHCLKSKEQGEEAYQFITRAMRLPDLSAERVDLFLRLALQARFQPYHRNVLCRNLVEALYVENVDARMRIHQALIYLAELNDTKDATFKKEHKLLVDWNPTAGNSVPDLEKWVDQWRAFFACQPATTVP
jgi:hypothetical protein